MTYARVLISVMEERGQLRNHGRLAGRLVGWLVGWLDGWLVGWLARSHKCRDARLSPRMDSQFKIVQIETTRLIDLLVARRACALRARTTAFNHSHSAAPRCFLSFPFIFKKDAGHVCVKGSRLFKSRFAARRYAFGECVRRACRLSRSR